jgi:hypothetical protein
MTKAINTMNLVQTMSRSLTLNLAPCALRLIYISLKEVSTDSLKLGLA